MQAAVKTAKEDLKNKSNELLMIQKQLAQEQKVGRGGEGGEVSTCPRVHVSKCPLVHVSIHILTRIYSEWRLNCVR